MLSADGFAMGTSGSGCIAQAFADAIHAMVSGSECCFRSDGGGSFAALLRKPLEQ
jgi:hypothetical protein